MGLDPSVVMTTGQVGTGFLESCWPKPRRENCDYCVMRDGIDFVNQLGAVVVVDNHEQNLEGK